MNIKNIISKKLPFLFLFLLLPLTLNTVNLCLAKIDNDFIYRLIRGELPTWESPVELDQNYATVIDGIRYKFGKGFEGFLVGKLDEEYGGIYSPDGVLIYKFKLAENLPITELDVIAENRIKTLKPSDRRYEYLRQIKPEKFYHNYTVQDLPFILSGWGIQLDVLSLKPEEQQHLVDIINFFSEDRVKSYIEKCSNLDLKKVLTFLIDASDPEAALLIVEKLPMGSIGAYSVQGSSAKLIYDYDILKRKAEEIGRQFNDNARGIITGQVDLTSLTPEFREKTFYLAEEIAESVLEAFKLVEIGLKFGIKNDGRWIERSIRAENDLMAAVDAMIEYGNGLIAEKSMGDSFPPSDKIEDDMIFYRTDEKKLYIYQEGDWEELSEGANPDERVYGFKFSSVNSNDANLGISIDRDKSKSHIRWQIKPQLSGLPGTSPELGIRIDAQDARLAPGVFQWKVELDLDSNELNRVFAQAMSLAVDIYDLTRTDHWSGGHHFWLEVFSSYSDINDFELVTKIYAPLFLFTP